MRRTLTVVLLASAFAAYPAVARQNEDQQKPRRWVPAATARHDIERNRQDQNRDERAREDRDRRRDLETAAMERRDDRSFNRNAVNHVAMHPKKPHKMHGHSARHHHLREAEEH